MESGDAFNVVEYLVTNELSVWHMPRASRVAYNSLTWVTQDLDGSCQAQAQNSQSALNDWLF